MARTATIPMPTNTPQATRALAPPLPEAASAQAMPDWLSIQRAILRDAPDNDTALRWQLAGALEHIADLERLLAVRGEAILRLQHPPPARRPVSWRPAILTLLRERGQPMSMGQITQALEAPFSLASRLLDMAKAGLLLRDATGGYGLPPDPTAAEPAPPARKKGRPVRAA